MNSQELRLKMSNCCVVIVLQGWILINKNIPMKCKMVFSVAIEIIPTTMPSITELDIRVKTDIALVRCFVDDMLVGTVVSSITLKMVLVT